MSWPPTTVDWLRLTAQLRHGDLVCIVHGRVDATIADWELPVCPHCRQLLSRAVRDGPGGPLVAFAEPFPAYCSGPERHLTVDGHVRVGWQSCQCADAVPGPGGHRWWRCSTCDARMQWPPHRTDRAAG